MAERKHCCISGETLAGIGVFVYFLQFFLKFATRNWMIHFNGQGWKEPFSAEKEQDKFVYSLGKEDFDELEFSTFVQKNSEKGFPVIGFFSYDFGLSRLEISSEKENNSNIPDVWFASVDSNQLIVNGFVEQREFQNFDLDFKSNIAKHEYEKSFEKIKIALREGEIYQANLTHLLQSEFTGNSWELFQYFYQRNPAEFAAYIDGGDWQVLSLSPERFVRIEPNGKIWTEPVKGTVSRGNTSCLPNSDQKSLQQLLDSEKEKAELSMITDLLRNDLGKVCVSGSVKVTKFREVMKLPNVWHTYSRIEGELIDFQDSKFKIQNSIKTILSMLPGGSITGCPKIRACSIIDQVEKNKRGIYTGTMVVFWPDGSVDSSILIRTVTRENDQLFLGVGGGIVIDSELGSEWDESWVKAKSFM